MRQAVITKRVSIDVVEKIEDQELGWKALTIKQLSRINGTVPKEIRGNLSMVKDSWLDKMSYMFYMLCLTRNYEIQVSANGVLVKIWQPILGEGSIICST